MLPSRQPSAVVELEHVRRFRVCLVNLAVTKQTFYAAPFSCDGEFLGLAQWDIGTLSDRWLGFCRDLLSRNGPVFTTTLPEPLHRIRLRFTSAQGAALATFSFDGTPVASSALLRGEAPEAERELLTMFVQSARRLDIVRRSQQNSEPFVEIFSIHERPLHAVITFGGADGAETIPELGTHLAGAFLGGVRPLDTL